MIKVERETWEWLRWWAYSTATLSVKAGCSWQYHNMQSVCVSVWHKEEKNELLVGWSGQECFTKASHIAWHSDILQRRVDDAKALAASGWCGLNLVFSHPSSVCFRFACISLYLKTTLKQKPKHSHTVLLLNVFVDYICRRALMQFNLVQSKILAGHSW